MKTALFAYGTLMFPEVIGALLGEVPQSEGAELLGYARVGLRGLCYPGLVHQEGARTAGRLYRALSRGQMRVVEAFEDELYARQRLWVTCEGGERVEALVYVVPASQRGLVDAELWQADGFLQEHGEEYLALCREVFACYGEKDGADVDGLVEEDRV